MTTPQTPLRIVSLQIENVKRLSAVHIEPDGATVVIGGNNAAGKSSVLDSIMMALAGEKCAKPVHGDETKGKVVVDLGELVVTRTFTPSGGGTLTVAAANGAKYSSPQTMLDAMLGKIAFDPLAFTRMKPAEQLTTLRELCGISTGMIDAGRAKAFEERTIVNRKVKELEAVVAAMPFYKDAPAEPVSAADITAELKSANEKNAAREEFIRQGKAKAVELGEQMTRISKLADEIDAMRKALTVAETKHADMVRGRELIHTELEEMRAKAADMHEIDTAGITAKLDQVGDLNRKCDENVRRGDAVDTLATWTKKADDLTAKIEDFDARKRAKLEEAKYPIEGLALTDDGITFNGLPFEQASSAEQLKVSVGIGLAMNPRLRVLLVKDGSLLDADSLAMVREMAEAAEAQVWIERVSKGDECSVVIEDGRVAQ